MPTPTSSPNSRSSQPPRPLSLNVLQIQSPCDVEWHTMSGTGVRRHCADCGLHVHDLAALPRREAEKLLALSRHQRICARVTRDAAGRVVTRDRWRPAKNGLAAAAGLTLAILGLTGCGDHADKGTGASPAPDATPVRGLITIVGDTAPLTPASAPSPAE